MTDAINHHTRDFIRQHQHDDVRQLALQGSKNPEVDLTMALQQIAGRQTARKKLPSWAAIDDILYPPHLNMEQCSSEQTARYKAVLAGSGDSFVDLTGGFGVDFYWMSQQFKQRVYIEQNAELCTLAEHNFHVLNHPTSVYCCDTATYLADMPHVDVAFLDPARRNEHGGRTYDIKDCTPNILELLPTLRKKATKVVLKLSPMFEWRKAVGDLKCVTEVHIVSVDNECKELLLVLESVKAPLLLVCINNDSIFEVTSSQLTTNSPHIATPHPQREKATLSLGEQPTVNTYLYEPNASIMKAGCFAQLEQSFPVRQLSANSHLFVSPDEINDFPGRRFQISTVTSMNKKELKQSLAGITQANITIRNFPMSVQQLRQKLKLKEGGNVYIFATTGQDGAHQLYICRKIG